MARRLVNITVQIQIGRSNQPSSGLRSLIIVTKKLIPPPVRLATPSTQMDMMAKSVPDVFSIDRSGG